MKEPADLDSFVRNVQTVLQNDSKICHDVVTQFKLVYPENCDHSPTALSIAATRIVSKRLLSNAIQLRRQRVGSLIRTYNNVRKITLRSKDDFGNEGHSHRCEPYFYDASYSYVNHQAYAVNENGKCFPLVYSIDENGQSSLVDPTNGCVDKCTSECKSIPQWEVNAIIDIRKALW